MIFLKIRESLKVTEGVPIESLAGIWTESRISGSPYKVTGRLAEPVICSDSFPIKDASPASEKLSALRNPQDNLEHKLIGHP